MSGHSWTLDTAGHPSSLSPAKKDKLDQSHTNQHSTRHDDVRKVASTWMCVCGGKVNGGG